MRITVTREDIEVGRRYDPVRCPVARALRRSGMVYFTVMESAVRLRDEERHGGLLVLPVSVQDWIRKFDRGEPVEQVSFELEALWNQQRDFAQQPGNFRGAENLSEEEEEAALLPPLPSADREALAAPACAD
jgi:hypothetical protein